MSNPKTIELSPIGLYTASKHPHNGFITENDWWADNDSFNVAQTMCEQKKEIWSGTGWRVIPQLERIEVPF